MVLCFPKRRNSETVYLAHKHERKTDVLISLGLHGLTVLPSAPTRKKRFQEERSAGLDSRYRGSQHRTRTAEGALNRSSEVFVVILTSMKAKLLAIAGIAVLGVLA